LKTPLLSALTTSSVIWGMVFANILGPRLVGCLEATTILLGVVPVLAIGCIGWFYFDPQIFWASWNVSGRPAVEAVPASLVLVFWAFTGLESAAVAVEVVDNPTRNLPIAVVGGVLIAASIYAFSCTALLGIVPAHELAASSAPFALVAGRTLGPVAVTIVVLTTMAKAAGTHGGWTLVSASTAKAAADGGLFPSVFARVDRRGVPVMGLLVLGGLMTAATFATMAPTIGEQFGRLIDVSVVFSMISYAYSALALLRMRTSGRPGAMRDRIVAVLAIAFSVWVIVASDFTLLLLAAAILATSIPLYFPFSQKQPAPPSGARDARRRAVTAAGLGADPAKLKPVMTRLRADLLLLLAAFIWGSAFVTQKYANDTMPPTLFVGARFFISALLLAPLAYRESQSSATRLRRRDFALAGLIGLSLFSAVELQQVGLVTTSVTNAGFITSLYIAFVPFVAWLLAGTKLRPSVLAACAVSLLGAWLLASHGQAAPPSRGDFLVLAAAVLTALHITLVSIFMANSGRRFFLCFVQYGVTSLCGVSLGSSFETASWHGLAAALPWILYAGAVSGGIAFTLQIVAQRHTPAAEAALIMSLESVFAASAAALVLGERLSLSALSGCALILMGVVMVEVAPAWPRRRSATKPA
jgi:drug/metabolite transporter (DMT)-like permease